MDLQQHVLRFKLEADGNSFETHSSWLMPVIWNRQSAMLKVFKPLSDEIFSGTILEGFAGAGAVRVLVGDEAALVLEWAGPQRVLDVYNRHGDGPAMDILLDTISKLHGAKQNMPSSAVPLRHWFQSLFEKSGELPVLSGCAEMARKLLNGSQNQVLLHGDIHHENVLLSSRGWLAIDPKGLFGDPAYEVSNLFCNPLQDATIVLQPERMRWLARLCAERLCLGEQKVLQFAYAHAGLSVSWEMEDGRDFSFRQKCAEGLEQLLKLA
jgi:streptomycin 6-kinase